jgi:hypothetical protein
MSWHLQVFGGSDPHYSQLVRMANWSQFTLVELEATNPQNLDYHDDTDSCLLTWVCRLLTWCLFGHLDQELTSKIEDKEKKEQIQPLPKKGSAKW